jgi:hypothetical protein
MIWELRSKLAFWLAFTAAEWIAPRYSLAEHLISFSKDEIMKAYDKQLAREEAWRV